MVSGRRRNTAQKANRVALRDDDLLFTPPTSPVLADASSAPAMRSEPSIIFLTTPPNSSSTSRTTPRPRRSRGLRASPSLVIVDEKTVHPEEKRGKSLRASPSIIIEDGPMPAPSRPRAKKARIDAPPAPSMSATAEIPQCQTQLPAPSEPYSPTPPPPSSLPSYMPSTSSAMAGSSSLAIPPPTQVPALSQPTPTSSKRKRKRKSEEEDEGEEEKRGARFKPKCPQNIMDRVQRVWQQRLFMIDRNRSEGDLRETFSVLGSTGNVYTVIIDLMPRCNCPDALKGNHCKHILFIFLKVLRVPEQSTYWYQKALLSSELEEIFSQAPMAPNCVAQTHIRDAHARATAQFSGPSSQSVKKRWPTKDDDCPICYETMFGVPENGLKFCDACGNAIHDECWKQWQASNLRSAKTVTCVWCRAEMNTGGVVKGRKSKGSRTQSDEGYLNLASVAGLSPVRDTSTYRGRWGRGYGRDYFDDY